MSFKRTRAIKTEDLVFSRGHPSLLNGLPDSYLALSRFFPPQFLQGSSNVEIFYLLLKSFDNFHCL